MDEHVNVMFTCTGIHVACNENLTEYGLPKYRVKLTSLLLTLSTAYIRIENQSLTCCNIIRGYSMCGGVGVWICMS